MALSQRFLQTWSASIGTKTNNHPINALSALRLLLSDCQLVSPTTTPSAVRSKHSASKQADLKSSQQALSGKTRPVELLEVSQSWTAEHRASDESLHKFATVIVENGRQQGAAALAWHHARKLLGGAPNVGVAYVSRPTPGSAAAVAELATRMGSSNSESSSVKSFSGPDTPGMEMVTLGKEQGGGVRTSPPGRADSIEKGSRLRTAGEVREEGARRGGPILFESETWQGYVRRGHKQRGFGRAEQSQKAVVYHASEFPQGSGSDRNGSARPGSGSGGSKGSEKTPGGILPLVGCTASSWTYRGEDNERRGVGPDGVKKNGGKTHPVKKGQKSQNQKKTFGAPQGATAGTPQSYIELPPLEPGGGSAGETGGVFWNQSPWQRVLYERDHQDEFFLHWSCIGFFDAIAFEEEDEEQSDGESEQLEIYVLKHGEGEASPQSDPSNDPPEGSLEVVGFRLRSQRESEPALQSSFASELDDREVYTESEYSDGFDPGEFSDEEGFRGGLGCGRLKLPVPTYRDGYGYQGLFDGQVASLEAGPDEGIGHKLQLFEVVRNYLRWRQGTCPADASTEELESILGHLYSEVHQLHSLQLEAVQNQVTDERRVFLRFAYTDFDGVPSDGIFFLSSELLPPDEQYDVEFETPRFEPIDPSDAVIRHVLHGTASPGETSRPLPEASGKGDHPPGGVNTAARVPSPTDVFSDGLSPGYTFIKRPDLEGTSVGFGEGGGEQSGPGEGLEDLPFRLTFVAGAMPGVKVEAFHTERPGLPDLANLEEMVLNSQPHFLLFGQPGFDNKAFRNRLASMFPQGAKAGVFSTPVSVISAFGGSLMSDVPMPSQLYFGDRTATKGVCGLALYSETEGVVPVDAFAAFVKEALGSPGFSGTFLIDDVISRELFRPSKKDASRAERRRTLHDNDEKLESLESLFRSWSAKIKGSVSAAPRKSRKTTSSAPATSTEEDSLWKGPKKAEEVLNGLQLANKYIEQRKASLEARFGPLGSEQGGADGGETTPPERDPRLEPGKVAKLPLFVVQPPPCPGETIERFIFEPRYRLLAKHCAEENSPLGVCSLDPDPATGQIVGTAASIDVIEYDEAYRSNVELHGLRRFRLTTPRIWVPPSSFGLYVGEVEFFDDAPCSSEPERRELIEVARRSVALFRRSYPSEWRRDKVLSADVTDPVAVSFALAEALPARNYTKQRWLASTCTRQRLQEQMHIMKEWSTQTSSKSESTDMDG